MPRSNAPDIARNTTRIKRPYTLEDAESFVRFAIDATHNHKEYPFVVCEHGQIIACARLAPAPLTSGHFFDNVASGRVLAKLGLAPTGEMKKMRSYGRSEEVKTVRLAMPAVTYRSLFKVEITG